MQNKPALVFSAGSGAYNHPAYYLRDAYARVPGRILLSTFSVWSTQFQHLGFGWDVDKSTYPRQASFLWNNFQPVWIVSNASTVYMPVTRTKQQYQFMRAAIALRSSGAFYFTQMGYGQPWLLEWVSYTGTTTPLYAGHVNYDAAAHIFNLQIPSKLWLPTPLSNDAFLSWPSVDGYALAEGGQNLISNPSFESAGGGGADIWANWSESVTDGALADETTIVHHGAHSAKVTSGALRTTSVAMYINVTPGLVYTITFWTRGDGTHAGRYRVLDNTHATTLTFVTTGVTGTEWQQITYTFTNPAGCLIIGLQFYAADTNGAIAYFDDALMMTPPESLGLGGSGGLWTELLGTWAAIPGTASALSLTGGIAIATVLTTLNKHTHVSINRSAGSAGIVTRYVDSSNYIYAVHDGTNATLHKVVSGVDTALFTTAAAYSAGSRMVLIENGTTFSLFYNNAFINTATISDTVLQTSTLTGLYTTSTANSLLKWAVWPLGTNNEYLILNKWSN